DQAVELYQSMLAFVVGFSTLGSGHMETGTEGLSPEFAQRMTEWRDETCAKTLRMIMRAYDSGRSEA
ncbi:MAG: hypothetical protein JW990_12320, partial [Thermoleophilia bacterium]|nr:hypothetical protein [Thermoleophilia bacterium]